MAAFGHLVPPQARVELGEPQKEHAATVVDPSLASTSKKSQWFTERNPYPPIRLFSDANGRSDLCSSSATHVTNDRVPIKA